MTTTSAAQLRAIFVFVILVSLNTTLAWAGDCSNMAMPDCFKSEACRVDCKRDTKHQGRCLDNKYFCRDRYKQCEEQGSQDKVPASKELCLSHTGCVFEEALCFCPCDFTGGCNCACGGGPPSRCVPIH